MSTATATKTKEDKVLVYRPLSILNCYEILSSDGVTLYPAEMTGPYSFSCSCKGGENGANCWHRKQALKTFTYYMYQSTWEEVRLGLTWVMPEAGFQATEQAIEAEAELDEVAALFAA